ncbi:MAG: hypothetical protein ACYCZJ_04815 [Sulfuriferula sp.]
MLWIICLVLLQGCASNIPSSSSPSIALEARPLQQARFVEFSYLDHQLKKVSYLDQQPQAEQSVPRMACTQVSPAPGQARNLSAWVWRSSELVRNNEAAVLFIQRAHAHGINEINVQVQPDLASFAHLLNLANESGIRVVALAGSPDDVLDPKAPLRIVHNVLQYNATHQQGFSGIQFDIEPYLIKSYRAQETLILDQYIQLLASLKAAAAGRIELGAAVPFWFAHKTLHGNNLMGLVAANVDRLAIMSYRTQLNQVLDIANNALCIGEMFGKPVDLGLEVTRLPDESSIVLSKALIDTAIRTQGDQIFLTRDPRDLHPVVQRVDIPASRLSFFPDTQKLFAMTNSPVPYRSFHGWIINGLDEVWTHD